MDLYESLMSGVSCEELIKTFYADLSAAEKRVKQTKEAEKIKQKKERITLARCNMILFMIAYMEELIEQHLSDDEITQLESILNDYFEAIEDAVFADPTLQSLDYFMIEENLEAALNALFN